MRKQTLPSSYWGKGYEALYKEAQSGVAETAAHMTDPPEDNSPVRTIWTVPHSFQQ